MYSIQDNIAACKQTRKLAAQSLEPCLHLLQGKVSEAMLCDTWLAEMRKSDAIFHQGWYDPPRDGFSVICGDWQTRRGYAYPSLRPKEMWPRKDTFFDHRGAGFCHVYASPVDRATGMIGDFEMTLYLGEDPKIRRHLQRCLQINKQIFDHIQIGMPFSEVHRFAMSLLHSHGLSNDITTLGGETNIGHTVPGLKGWTAEEHLLLQDGDSRWDEVKDLIGAKRTFVRAEERTTYQPRMVTTIEPRPSVVGDPTVPNAGFHMMAAIHPDGTKELFTDFEEIFKMVGMDYMLGL